LFSHGRLFSGLFSQTTVKQFESIIRPTTVDIFGLCSPRFRHDCESGPKFDGLANSLMPAHLGILPEGLFESEIDRQVFSNTHVQTVAAL